MGFQERGSLTSSRLHFCKRKASRGEKVSPLKLSRCKWQRGNSWNSSPALRFVCAPTWATNEIFLAVGTSEPACWHKTGRRTHSFSAGECSKMDSSWGEPPSLLAWLGFSLVSSVEDGRSLLFFFLAKKSLKLWNLDFFLPVQNKPTNK